MDSPEASVRSVSGEASLGLQDIIINKPGLESRKDMALALSLLQSHGFMILRIKKS